MHFTLLGVDRERGWLLSARAGDTLRSLTRSPDQLQHWSKILPLYSQLQIEMADRVPALLSFGVPDQRLSRLPAIYAQLLEDSGSLLLDRAFSWYQGLAALPAEEKKEYADSVPGWLQDYLQAESAEQ